MKDLVDYGVLGILGALSVIVLAVALERFWFYATMRVSDYADKRVMELDLSRRLTLIATIGANAPYIGLLGTVLGIMLTFTEIGSGGVVSSNAIMEGLALALKATAGGLIVAIPSIVFYNFLVAKSERLLKLWEIENGAESAKIVADSAKISVKN